jgi:hypothetical protein
MSCGRRYRYLPGVAQEIMFNQSTGDIKIRYSDDTWLVLHNMPCELHYK